MQLGINKDKNLIYEGSGNWGQPLWPSPIVVPAIFVSTKDETLSPADGKLNPNSYVFRELAYDPVSRVRRGMLYHAGGTQPSQWYVSPHPAVNQDNREMDRHGVVNRQLYTFDSFCLRVVLKEITDGQPLVLLGTEKSFSIWSILAVEGMVAGDEIVVLKSRQSFGSIPQLINDAIPALGRNEVIEAVNVLEEDYHRAGAESVVDRAREVATVILSIYLQNEGAAPKEKDLGKLVSALGVIEKRGKQIVSSAATITRILHSRGKHAVKQKMPVRDIAEQDAELSVSCIGVMLCDLGWAKW